MRKFLFVLSAIVVLICLVVSGFFFWRLKSPGNSFPLVVDGLRRVVGPEYRKDETYPGVYAAVYAPGLEKLAGKDDLYVNTETSFFHTLYPTSSPEEARELVRKNRETWKKEAERYKGNESSSSSYGNSGIFIAPEDNPENDYLVYIANGRANVQWVSGNWFCTVYTSADRVPSYESEIPYSAASAFDFARSLPYAPKGTTPPSNEYDIGFTLYDLIKTDIPILFRYWYPMIIPLIIMIPALLVMLLTLVFSRKKHPKTLNVG
jgi:hypothetical protein